MAMVSLYLKMALIIRGNSLIMKFKVKGNTTMEIRIIMVNGNIMKSMGLGV